MTQAYESGTVLRAESELTPTLKLRCKLCEDHYRAEIQRLYSGGL